MNKILIIILIFHFANSEFFTKKDIEFATSLGLDTIIINERILNSKRGVCYGILGCFDNSPPFNNAGFYLPINPDVLKTKFQLYTNSIGLDYLNYIDENSIKNSKYNKNYPLKIIIHGFQNTGQTPWVIELARNIMIAENGNVNIIIVDWGIGAVFPLYLNASANTRLVGRQTCFLTKLIKKVFYQDMWSKDFNIHCIGHSLGAHTCGYASSDCESAFDRISALDPAGPFFESFDIKVRIDPSDAKFVDVIHSNGDDVLSGSFGMRIPCGHVDFYPNGGQQQPGCPNLVLLAASLLTNTTIAINGISCSHGRAINYFTESINSNCKFKSYPCGNMASFDRGECLECWFKGCSDMGYYASTNITGIKYMKTRSSEPYCTYPYFLELRTGSIEKKTIGEIIISFGEFSNNITLKLTKLTDSIRPNALYRQAFVIEKSVSSFDQAYIEFKKNQAIYTDTSEIFINKVKLTIIGDNDKIYSFCSPEFQVNNEKKMIKLQESDCYL